VFHIHPFTALYIQGFYDRPGTYVWHCHMLEVRRTDTHRRRRGGGRTNGQTTLLAAAPCIRLGQFLSTHSRLVLLPVPSMSLCVRVSTRTWR
jgi:hypothetical protein